MSETSDWRPYHYGLIGLAALIAVAAFLPWAEARAGIFSVSKNGIDGDGAVTLVVALLVAGVVAANAVGKMPDGTARVLTIIGGIIVSAIGIYDWSDFQRLNDAQSDAVNVTVSVQGGLIITTAAGVALTIVAFASWSRRRRMSIAEQIKKISE